MIDRRAAPLLPLVLLAVLACRAEDAGVAREYGVPPVVSMELGAMRDVSVSDGVWIGSFPSPADFDLARRRGIETAIDLSLPDESFGFDVAQACRGVDLEYVRIAADGGCPIPDDAVDRTLAELRRPGRGPVLVFCGNGGRAAMVFAIWLALDRGLPLEEALVEGRRAGMKPGCPEEFVRRQAARLSARP